MKRVIIGIMFCVLLISLVVAENDSENKIIGGQRDEHNCLPAAGYSWNETEQKCVREWEKGDGRYQNVENETEKK